MRHSRGFTLIELMVAVAVLAILMVLAGPSFSDFFDRFRLRGAADEVASVVANARAEALMRNREVAVVFTGSGADWCVGANSAPDPGTPGEQIPAAPSCDCSGDCKLGGRVTESHGSSHNGVQMTTVPPRLTFTRLTGAVQGLGSTTATLSSPSGKYRLNVVVAPLGRGQLCVPAGSPAMSGFAPC